MTYVNWPRALIQQHEANGSSLASTVHVFVEYNSDNNVIFTIGNHLIISMR